MKRTLARELKIPLADFLMMNGHTLLEMCNELPDWKLFLDYIGYFLETDSFETRGSCIAQVVIKLMCDYPHGLLDEEKDPYGTDTATVLVPYTTMNVYLRDDEDLDKKLSPAEIDFLQPFFMGVNKKNIDIYQHLEEQSEIDYYANAFKKSFPNKRRISVANVKKLPNGIAALKLASKFGYPDNEVILALKPPLQRDLRKNMSNRQLSCNGTVQKEGDNWFVIVEAKNVERILSKDSIILIGPHLGIPQFMLQIARTLRFNSIYEVQDGDEIDLEELDNLGFSLSHLEEKDVPHNKGNSEYLYAQAMNEYMISFLNNPKLFIRYISKLPDWCFPNINREALAQNADKICAMLKGQPREYYSTPEDERVDLTNVAALLVGNEEADLYSSEVGKKYKPVIDSIDSKLDLTEGLEQEFAHTSWYFGKCTNYYLFQMLFYPVSI